MEYRVRQYTFESGVLLGAGGMAQVFAGSRKDDPDFHVAIKVPLPAIPTDIAELFLREAEAAQRVAGPNAVRVVDWGESPRFIAFEYIDAPTLRQEIQSRLAVGSFWQEAELVALFRDLVEGMKSINQHVIHRDLKPDNIFVTEDGLKIGDFGISKYVGELTRTRTFKGWGTVSYMAPETFLGESVDWRADQYSLGVLFYEMACLRPPFIGDWDELQQKHLYERPPRVTSTHAYREALATTVARMLEKSPGQRFPSWTEVDQSLQNVEESVGPVTAPDDPLAPLAAERLERIRARTLQEQRQQDEAQRKLDGNTSLCDYWADDFFSQIQTRVDSLNKTLGEPAVACQVRRGSKKGAENTCSVTFAGSTIRLFLEPMPIEVPDEFVAWGSIRAQTKNRIALAHLLLVRDPPPYGTWYEVTLRVSGIISRPRPSIEGEDKGCRYEVIGSDRLVVALNWKGLLYQRELKNSMSVVDYKEEELEFTKTLDQLLGLLVEDAD